LPRANALIEEIRACTVCSNALAAGPRPIVQFSPKSRLVIIGQAPGSKVHQSGVPWQDDSGDRLRAWTGLTQAEFYDPARVALMPMGFCYPGKGRSGDLPPRRECAPLWHERVLGLLPNLELILLVGSYAIDYYLPERKKPRMADTVEAWRDYLQRYFPLPHPSWRTVLFERKNPWFEADVLPALKKQVKKLVAP